MDIPRLFFIRPSIAENYDPALFWCGVAIASIALIFVASLIVFEELNSPAPVDQPEPVITELHVKKGSDQSVSSVEFEIISKRGHQFHNCGWGWVYRIRVTSPEHDPSDISPSGLHWFNASAVIDFGEDWYVGKAEMIDGDGVLKVSRSCHSVSYESNGYGILFRDRYPIFDVYVILDDNLSWDGVDKPDGVHEVLPVKQRKESE